MGNKANKLKILKDNGYLVPDFVEVNPGDNISKKLLTLDTNIRFAVRSNMLIEDGANSSHAGQFKTIIDVDFRNIEESINDVMRDARNKGLSDNKISVIVQEYIKFDYSGVSFTRNPNGGREMLIEYHKGIGEDIVSGRVLPNKIGIYHNEINYINKCSGLSNNIGKTEIIKFINDIKNIESLFFFPQDIEWGIKGGEIYFLQSRNITNISKDSYSELLILENELKDDKKFYYEKNEVSEIAPRPCYFTYSLLKKIYSEDGPIDTFYKKNKINIPCEDFLKIIGNELYVDKEKELANIYPSLTYLGKNSPSISIKGFSGMLKTIGHIYKLSSLRFSFDNLHDRLINKINTFVCSPDINKSISYFFDDYCLIYEINFFTGRTFKKLERALKNSGITFSEALHLHVGKDFEKEYTTSMKGLIGNSIDIADESSFSKNEVLNNHNNKNSKWNSLPQWKQRFLKPYIIDATNMQNLREKTRHLTVLHINNIRKNILIIGKMSGLDHTKDVYFSSCGELLKGKVDLKNITERKSNYQKFNDYSFPRFLMNRYHEESKDSLIGISSGTSEGIIVTKDNINIIHGKKILLVSILSPDLIEYFDKINGIISETGGILSHLSILARERGIPVISGYNKDLYGLETGDKVKINGLEGTIDIID